jgi:divalent metal cation (Fe/Co/Zn/Cd) transporter
LVIHALIADAIESTTDILLPFLVLFGIKYSNRPADKTTHMDTVAEPLITFIVVGFLITSATIIAYESILNIRIAHDLNLGLFLFWGNNYLKEYSFRLVMRRSVETNSSSLKADA